MRYKLGYLVGFMNGFVKGFKAELTKASKK
jgi:hypothetical protein